MDRAFKKHYRQLALNLELMERNPGTMATIDRLLKQHQIPQDFRYLPVIESRLTLDTSHKGAGGYWQRSEEHTSELQSLMRISYAVFCLKKKKRKNKSITK